MAVSYQRHSDQTLIQYFHNGDQTALEALISRHKDKVYSTIYYLVKDKFVTEDLFQDTFLKMLAHLEQNKYMEQGKFSAWLLRIARNLCIDHFRRIKQARSVNVVMADGTDLMECLEDRTGYCEKHIIKQEVEDSVQCLIERLPCEQREVVVLRIYGELSFKEIAEITGVSINTSLGRMRYALKNMRQMISENSLVLR